MSFDGNNSGEGGNMWSSGSRGGGGGGGYGSRGGGGGGYSRPNYRDNDGGSRGGGSYRGSFGNNNARRGGYGFRRQNDGGAVEIQTDAVFIQNLPKSITADELNDIFSSAGNIKFDERSGGPKIWIYKDRETNEPNGRATVTYEDDDSAQKAIATFNDQHIESIDAVVRVQLAQRRTRTDNNDRGGGRGGYRGGRSNWDDNRNTRQGFGNGGGGDRWDSPREGFSGGRGGGGFRGNGGESFRNDDDDRGGSYRGGRGGASGGFHRGASRGISGSTNYSPY